MGIGEKVAELENSHNRLEEVYREELEIEINKKIGQRIRVGFRGFENTFNSPHFSYPMETDYITIAAEEIGWGLAMGYVFPYRKIAIIEDEKSIALIKEKESASNLIKIANQVETILIDRKYDVLRSGIKTSDIGSFINNMIKKV